MDEKSGTGGAGEKDSPPLQIDPKWYVQHITFLGSLTVEWM